jgi:TRAP-type mannitol/chloroaromatic compound transport system permease small subunit
MTRVRALIFRFAELTGTAIAWLTVLMVLGTFVIVVLRYVFDLGWIWMQESITWMHAAVFMLGAAYTLKRDEHVRVDIFYRRMSRRRQAIVDLVGTLLFLVPMTVFLATMSLGYVGSSWSIHEASREAGGLPYPFVPLLKTLIPITAALLVLQGLADIITCVLTLQGRIAPGSGQEHVPPGEVI